MSEFYTFAFTDIKLKYIPFVLLSKKNFKFCWYDEKSERFKIENSRGPLSEKQMAVVKRSISNFSEYNYVNPELSIWSSIQFEKVYINWDAFNNLYHKFLVSVADRNSINDNFRFQIRSKCYDNSYLIGINARTLNEIIPYLPDDFLATLSEKYFDERDFIMEEYTALKNFEDVLDDSTKLLLENNRGGKKKPYDGDNDLPF